MVSALPVVIKHSSSSRAAAAAVVVVAVDGRAMCVCVSKVKR
jgi:hypothetical protein